MSILRRLFGGGPEPAAEDPIEALRSTADGRALRRLGVRHRAAFRHGAEHHDAFRAAAATRVAVPATPASSVHVVHWEDLVEPTVRSVVDLAAVTELPYLLLRTRDPRAESGAAGELEALVELERDDAVALVLVGDVDLVLRRSFLVALLASDALPDAEEVIPELCDLAAARGMQAKFVPA